MLTDVQIPWEKVLEIGGPVATYLVILLLAVKQLTKKQEHHDLILKKVVTDVAVIKTQILSALSTSQDVKEHDRDLVRQDERIKKNSKDIQNQYDRIKSQDSKIEVLEKEIYSKH